MPRQTFGRGLLVACRPQGLAFNRPCVCLRCAGRATGWRAVIAARTPAHALSQPRISVDARKASVPAPFIALHNTPKTLA
jgi:hypothetical protein